MPKLKYTYTPEEAPCVFVGSYEYEGTVFDLYYKLKYEMTVIARYGNDGSEYTSGLCFADKTNPLKEAKKRAEQHMGRTFQSIQDDERRKRLDTCVAVMADNDGVISAFNSLNELSVCAAFLTDRDLSDVDYLLDDEYFSSPVKEAMLNLLKTIVEDFEGQII